MDERRYQRIHGALDRLVRALDTGRPADVDAARADAALAIAGEPPGGDELATESPAPALVDEVVTDPARPAGGDQ